MPIIRFFQTDFSYSVLSRNSKNNSARNLKTIVLSLKKWKFLITHLKSVFFFFLLQVKYRTFGINLLVLDFSDNSVRSTCEHNCSSFDVLWHDFCHGSGRQCLGNMDSDV